MSGRGDAIPSLPELQKRIMTDTSLPKMNYVWRVRDFAQKKTWKPSFPAPASSMTLRVDCHSQNKWVTSTRITFQTVFSLHWQYFYSLVYFEVYETCFKRCWRAVYKSSSPSGLLTRELFSAPDLCPRAKKVSLGINNRPYMFLDTCL